MSGARGGATLLRERCSRAGQDRVAVRHEDELDWEVEERSSAERPAGFKNEAVG
ncbi:MAG: hypothetical protein M3265_07285 [Actinomycetota bacterium]|nr:hypothetical protein [Actinomycetota bacterium]